MKKLIIAMGIAQMALAAAAAPSATRDSAIRACLKVFPDATSPVDDKARTFAQDDRINLEFNYKGVKLVCSVGKASAEAEEASVMGRKFSKEDLKASQARREGNDKAVDQIAAGDLKSFPAAAKAKVAKKLQNPESARFKDVYISYVENDQPTLCGKVSGKNPSGAYTDYRGFVSNASVNYIAPESGEDHMFKTMHNEFCNSRFADVQ
jgi:hypothetical protein